MKTMADIIKRIALLVTILVTAGCIEELDRESLGEDYICFTASLDEDQTKAAPMNQLSGTASVTGFLGVRTTSDDGSATTAFRSWDALKNTSFKFDGDQMKPTGSPIGWGSVSSQISELRIFSYAPMATEGSTYSLNKDLYPPTLSYTVPSNVSNQTDIVVASAVVETSGYRQSIPLQFTHALTGIQFRSGFTEQIRVNSITITGVADSGTYIFGTGWQTEAASQNTEFTIDFGTNGKSVGRGEMITGTAEVFMMLPQEFAQTNSLAKVTMTYADTNEESHTVTTSLNGAKWEEGDMITYTLNPKVSNTTDPHIYFDLEAGNVTIDGTSYTGYVYEKDGTGTKTRKVSGTHNNANRYYVYQSSSKDSKFKTVWEGNSHSGLPVYPAVKHGDILWSDWITDNTDVMAVIDAWDNKEGTSGDAVNAKRDSTNHRIHVSGTLICNMTIDNIYSRCHHKPQNRDYGTITFLPDEYKISEFTINIVGDNRVGCIHYASSDSNLKNKLILEGTGSLTAADADFHKNSSTDTDYYSNHYDSVIGGSDDDENSYGIIINSGTIFAGSTKKENCSCIGGGGNGPGHVTINGGRVTAVASTTGTAIGGGIGYSSQGGAGYVYINGGNIYAYNFRNVGTIPSSAIGGAGSKQEYGNLGRVEITGGNVYAYSEDGTAIGGGSSVQKQGGSAEITIKGNATVIAKTGAENASIGGGKGTTGGTATVNIEGNPIIRTGSVGGGNATAGKIGSAKINIKGGDIQAQFVMAAGAEIQPTFTMTGGTIRHSNAKTYTNGDEYRYIKTRGGAVYLEDGSVNISGNSKILNCSAEQGGAIFVTGENNPIVNIAGGVIQDCTSKTNGGAIYLEGGTVNMTGGTISGNLAKAGNGGGICIVGGNFYMPAPDDGTNTATITQNAAFNGSGGGLYVTSASGTVDVKILSGNITSNSSDRYGGGICVDINSDKNNPQSTAAANIVIGTPKTEEEPADIDPVVTRNHASLQGGGLYAKGSKANISINSGYIRNNSISGYEANMDVANEGGMVELIDGDVPHVEVEYNNNYEYYFKKTDGVVKPVQKIVTATNSIMVVPTGVTIPAGYEIVGWNTRPDGKGESVTAGQILNLSDNLRLYAQWR